jgi:hypothetical protein
MRQTQAALSIETPCQTFGCQARRSATSPRRSARFVSTWNVCQCASAITAKTWDLFVEQAAHAVDEDPV